MFLFCVIEFLLFVPEGELGFNLSAEAEVLGLVCLLSPRKLTQFEPREQYSDGLLAAHLSREKV